MSIVLGILLLASLGLNYYFYRNLKAAQAGIAALTASAVAATQPILAPAKAAGTAS